MTELFFFFSYVEAGRFLAHLHRVRRRSWHVAIGCWTHLLPILQHLGKRRNRGHHPGLERRDPYWMPFFSTATRIDEATRHRRSEWLFSRPERATGFCRCFEQSQSRPDPFRSQEIVRRMLRRKARKRRRRRSRRRQERRRGFAGAGADSKQAESRFEADWRRRDWTYNQRRIRRRAHTRARWSRVMANWKGRILP